MFLYLIQLLIYGLYFGLDLVTRKLGDHVWFIQGCKFCQCLLAPSWAWWNPKPLFLVIFNVCNGSMYHKHV